MPGIRDSLRTSLLAVLVVVLAAALMWILLRQALILVALLALALLALRLASGGRTRRAVDDCASCGRDIPRDARICPYCFELQPGG